MRVRCVNGQYKIFHITYWIDIVKDIVLIMDKLTVKKTTFFIIVIFVMSNLFMGIEQVMADNLIANLAIGVDGSALEYNPNNNSIYLAHDKRGSIDNQGFVSVIDGDSNIRYATVQVGTTPVAIKFNPSNGDIYVVNQGSNTVSVIDGVNNTVIGNIQVGQRPSYIEYNPSNGDIYVVNQGSNTVSVIDGVNNTVSGTINVVDYPLGIKYNPGNKDIYIPTGEDTDKPSKSSVVVIDSATNRVIDNIKSIGQANNMDYNPSNGYLYIANKDIKSISVIDSKNNTFIGTINVGGPQSDVLFDPINDKLYVSVDNHYLNDESEGFLTAIDTTTNRVVSLYTTGISSGSLEINPYSNHIYVTSSPNYVYVIDGNTDKGINAITVGQQPNEIKFNPDNKNLYVANNDDSRPANTLSIILDSDLKIDNSKVDNIKTAVNLLKDLLSKNPESSISSKSIENAIHILSDNNDNNDRKACNLLGTTINKQTTSLQQLLNC